MTDALKSPPSDARGLENDLLTLLHTMELPQQGVNLRVLTRAIEKVLILQALLRTEGNQTYAASLLQMNRTTMYMRMKSLGIVDKPVIPEVKDQH